MPRWLSSRPLLRALAAGGLAALAVAAGVVATSRGPAAPAASAVPAVAAPGPASALLVFVSGAVAHPGLYHLAGGARVADAIADAGGVLTSADPGRLPDRAAVLHDGHQVTVPFARSSAPRATSRIDVNTADVAELAAIPGMTVEMARAIVDTRSLWGPFANLADLRLALGLDRATAALLGRHLSFLTTLR